MKANIKRKLKLLSPASILNPSIVAPTRQAEVYQKKIRPKGGYFFKAYYEKC